MTATKGLSKKGESVSTITRLFPGDDSGGYNQHRCRGTDSSVVIGYRVPNGETTRLSLAATITLPSIRGDVEVTIRPIVQC